MQANIANFTTKLGLLSQENENLVKNCKKLKEGQSKSVALKEE